MQGTESEVITKLGIPDMPHRSIEILAYDLNQKRENNILNEASLVVGLVWYHGRPSEVGGGGGQRADEREGTLSERLWRGMKARGEELHPLYIYVTMCDGAIDAQLLYEGIHVKHGYLLLSCNQRSWGHF